MCGHSPVFILVKAGRWWTPQDLLCRFSDGALGFTRALEIAIALCTLARRLPCVLIICDIQEGFLEGATNQGNRDKDIITVTAHRMFSELLPMIWGCWEGSGFREYQRPNGSRELS